MIDDIDRLDAALDGHDLAVRLPESLEGLIGVAAEVARALALPVLTAADRERLYQRAMHGRNWQERLRHELPRLARRPTVVGVGGAAAVTLAVVGIAILRGRSHGELGTAAA